jgi:trigger factor
MRKDLEAKNKQTMEDQKTNNVLTAIIGNSTISSYPQTLLDYYSAQMKNYYTQYASYYGTDFAGFLEASGMTQEDFDKETKSYAEKMASQELVIKSVIEAEKMELTDDEYQKGLTDLAKEYGYTSNDEFLKQAKEEDVKETLLWKKALDFVSSQAVVS